MKKNSKQRWHDQEFITDLAVYKKWLQAANGDNSQNHKRLLALTGKAIREELTEKQRLYLTEYYIEQKNMESIASIYGVDKSSVSRVISNGRRRLKRVLQYAAPELIGR